MVRTIAFFLLATVLLGTIAAPGLAAFALVLAPLLGLGLVWRIALAIATRGRSSEAIVQTRHGHFLGPGGPDDPFADSAGSDEF